jgi:hypothetical protein
VRGDIRRSISRTTERSIAALALVKMLAKLLETYPNPGTSASELIACAPCHHLEPGRLALDAIAHLACEPEVCQFDLGGTIVESFERDVRRGLLVSK